jgi:outer membrane protein insertion porin family/translocation and assembly module TamA
MRRFSVLTTLIAVNIICTILFAGKSFASPELLHKSKFDIDDIEFVFKTTQTFDEADLLSIMNLPKLSSFSQYELDLDRQRMRKFYFDNGFFDAVVDTLTEYDTEDESVVISIIIIENNRYKLEKISFEGLETISPELQSRVNADKLLVPGNYYSKSFILIESARIVTILQNNGYFYAALDTAEGTVVSKYQSSDPSLKYRVSISLKFMGAVKQYSFGKTKINIADNRYKLQNSLIERELNYKEGQLYNRELLNQSERNLTKFAIIQTGRFSIDTVIDNTLMLRVDISLNDKYEITPNILALNDEAVNQFFVGAGVQYTDKNFFGGGRVFTVSLQGLAHSRYTYRAILNTSLYQPYFIRNNMTLTYTLRLEYNNIDKGYQVLRASNLLRTNYYIAYYTFYNNAYSDITFDFVRTKLTSEYIRNTLKIEAPDSLTNSINSIIGLTLVHDNTNDIFNPSGGFIHSITVENAGLIPRIVSLANKSIEYSQYVKLYMPNKFYFDLSGGRATSIFATYNEIGDIIEYGKGDNIVDVPQIYKFYSGGSSSLRGWNAKENGMLVNPGLGGKFLFEGAFEYRWKMFATSQSFLNNFWSVYFIDYGNVWESDGFFMFKQIALAAGFGIRYDTFVGPLRIDFGFKLYNPKAPENDQWLFDNPKEIFKGKLAIQFGLGNAF